MREFNLKSSPIANFASTCFYRLLPRPRVEPSWQKVATQLRRRCYHIYTRYIQNKNKKYL
tara:strand:- start:663 stop:842 length:180 start_codon:yes stop_codon:yes gene_type:complete